MRKVQPPSPRPGTRSRKSARAGQQLRKGSAQLAQGPKNVSSALGAYTPDERIPSLADDEDEKAAFIRKHAADLEEESRRNVSAESNAERVRQEEEEERRRKVKGFNFDERRKKKGRLPFDEDEKQEEQEQEAEQRAKELIDSSTAGTRDRGFFEESPHDRMGDENLTNPKEMKRVLGASVRFAQHAMLLAHIRMLNGNSRTEALSFLADLYQRIEDQPYAEKALRMFGAGTGIIDLYPLELVDHLLEHVPGFLTRTRRQELFGGKVQIQARPKEDIILQYNNTLRIRGFAIEGGARPGYRFEPTNPDGYYRLSLDLPGNYNILISAISRDGWVLLDRLSVEISTCAPSPAVIHAEQTSPSEAAPSSQPPPEKSPPEKSELPRDLSNLAFPRRI